MSGAVTVVLVALAVATLLSFMLWFISRVKRQREVSLQEYLDVVLGRSDTSVSPASGVVDVKPMRKQLPVDHNLDDFTPNDHSTSEDASTLDERHSL